MCRPAPFRVHGKRFPRFRARNVRAAAGSDCALAASRPHPHQGRSPQHQPFHRRGHRPVSGARLRRDGWGVSAKAIEGHLWREGNRPEKGPLTPQRPPGLAAPRQGERGGVKEQEGPCRRMWPLYLHSMAKPQAFSPVFPPMGSMPGIFYWLSVWHFKE